MKNICLLLIVLFSCKQKENKQIDPNQTFFELSLNEKLKFESSFSECGEWGGHNESIIIYSKGESVFYIDYMKTQVDCNKRDENGHPIQTPKIEKTIKINEENKKSLFDYIKRMAISKTEESFSGNYGNTFIVSKSDGSLFIKVYDNNKYNVTSYNTLLGELKL